MIVLGYNGALLGYPEHTGTGHDSSAAIVVDGDLVAACEEERFDREKHSAKFPEQAIAFCLNIKGEPIVNTPADAVRCFLGTQIDLLVLHDVVLEKRPEVAAALARERGRHRGAGRVPWTAALTLRERHGFPDGHVGTGYYVLPDVTVRAGTARPRFRGQSASRDSPGRSSKPLLWLKGT